MTQLDVLYRYGAAPTETASLALAKVREVYGVRRVAVNEAEKTIRVEYDATRLNEPVIRKLLRRAGIDLVENIQMFTLPAPAPAAAAQ